MFNKLLLNNEFLANKKKVKQAKIVTINKLVQKIRKLKSFAEKEPENTKVQEKLLKTTEVLACAKKLKSIEILRKALINEKNPNTIITNGSSLPEEIAEATLFSTKQISDIVKHIKDLLSLNDESNPGWKNQILELSKKKQKQLRTDQKKEIRQQRKERHQLTLKRTEWLEDNLPENLLIKDNPSESKELEINVLENKAAKNLEKKKKTLKNIKEKPKKANKVIKVNNDEKANNDIAEELEVVNNIKEKRKKDFVNKVKKVNYDEKSQVDIKEELEAVKAVDPFFITQNGGNYLSTVVIDRVQPEAPNDGMVRKERRSYQNNSNQKQIRKNNYKNIKNVGISKMKTIETNNKWKINAVNQNKSINQKEINQTEEKLHPSWACKQKERGIKDFSGKKIVFDDNEEGKVVENIVNKSWKSNENPKVNKGFSAKKIFGKIESKSIIKTEEKLHPSWAAKQKLKPVISAFKGKKIKFDD